MKCRVGRRLIDELRRVIKHRYREQFRGRDEAGEGREPEIQPQRRKNDEDEIGQRHREGQSLGGPHRLHLQIQPNDGQAGFDQGAEIAARIGHVAALRQPRTDQPQHRQFEQVERHKGRNQLQDRGVTVPNPFDDVGRDRIGNDKGCHQQRDGDEGHLDPQQLGRQDFARQRVPEIGRQR